MICLAYVDDCIFFSKDYETIDRCIGKLRAQDLNLTVEQDVHAFLGVQIKRNADGSVETLLLQQCVIGCRLVFCLPPDLPPLILAPILIIVLT